MRFAGQVTKSGNWWATEVPLLGAYSQARTKRDALRSIKCAIEELVEVEGFHVDVYPGKGSYFEVGAVDDAALIAFFLRQQRGKSGQTLEQVARALGQRSANAYARYEQGVSSPTVEKLTRLLRALEPGSDYVLHKSGVDAAHKI